MNKGHIINYGSQGFDESMSMRRKLNFETLVFGDHSIPGAIYCLAKAAQSETKLC